MKATFTFIPVIVIVLLIGSCVQPKPEPAPGGQSYHLARRNMSHTHNVGGSPCPDHVGETKVSCSKAHKACSADSAFVKNDHPYLRAYFSNDTNGTVLTDTVDTKLNVEFNCGQAQSQNHTFEVNFYQGGSMVESEELKVDLTVQ